MRFDSEPPTRPGLMWRSDYSWRLGTWQQLFCFRLFTKRPSQYCSDGLEYVIQPIATHKTGISVANGPQAICFLLSSLRKKEPLQIVFLFFYVTQNNDHALGHVNQGSRNLLCHDVGESERTKHLTQLHHNSQDIRGIESN